MICCKPGTRGGNRGLHRVEETLPDELVSQEEMVTEGAMPVPDMAAAVQGTDAGITAEVVVFIIIIKSFYF